VGFAGNLTERNGTAYIECLRCPKGARCDIEGVDYKNMSTLSGWWQVRSFEPTAFVPALPSHRAERRNAVLIVRVSWVAHFLFDC
jgi:hypothetical protein